MPGTHGQAPRILRRHAQRAADFDVAGPRKPHRKSLLSPQVFQGGFLPPAARCKGLFNPLPRRSRFHGSKLYRTVQGLPATCYFCNNVRHPKENLHFGFTVRTRRRVEMIRTPSQYFRCTLIIMSERAKRLR